jgi:hypothetical protein
MVCKQFNIPFDRDAFLYLIQKWYRETNRQMQCVHPRDLVRTIVALCEYEGVQPCLTKPLIDEACRSYFVS